MQIYHSELFSFFVVQSVHVGNETEDSSTSYSALQKCFAQNIFYTKQVQKEQNEGLEG